MRFLDLIRLNEMNVANLDTLKTEFEAMLTALATNVRAQIPKPLFDLIVKRAVRAMQNDDASNMTTKRSVAASELDDTAPAWLKASLERGDEVVELRFKDGFQDRLAHVVDWLAADPQAARTVKACPEQDFLGHLAQAADAFFEKYNAEVAKSTETAEKKQHALGEPGREVVMVFRRAPQTNAIIAVPGSDLSDTAQGPVVCFWVKLISPEALNREGKLMNHCVGSYANLVKAEDVVIYSLRDMKNEPHVTVELNTTAYGTPTINQVKGKGNRPPPGRYSVYVRDFLNAIGANASSGGKTDLQGLGLLSHEGKFGTILDVGGNIQAAFDNGDTIRSLDHDDVCFYVEKDGTTPFSFFKRTDRMRDGDKTSVSISTIFRKEVSRFPVYARNMIKYLNENRLRGPTKTFEVFGVFYDKRRSLWGTRDDLSETLFEYKGVTVSRIVEDIFFSDRNATIFATAELVHNQLRKIKIINECDATKLIPALVLEFGNRVIKVQMPNKESRDYFADYGVFWNTAKETYTTVPDEKSVIFKSKSGQVCLYMNRLFFFDPAKTLIGSFFVGKEKTPFTFVMNNLNTFNAHGTSEILAMLSQMSNRADPLLKIEYVDPRLCRENGYYRAADRLIPLAEVEKTYRLGGGHVASVQVSDDGTKEIALRKGEENLVVAYVNGEDVVRSIHYWREVDDQGRRVPKARDEHAIRPYLAAMLNAAGVKMPLTDALDNYLVVRKDKFAALDPKRDRMMVSFVTGIVDLGNHFRFRRQVELDSRTKRDLDSYQDKRFGYLEYMEPDDDEDKEEIDPRWRYGSTVCNIEFSTSHQDSLSYHMNKTLPRGVTRQQVIAAVAKFMHYYHDKIEPMLSTRIFWSAGSAKPSATDEDNN